MKELLREYRRQGFKPTVRQIFYRLVSERLLPNLQKAYKALDSRLTREREEGLEAFGWEGENEYGDVSYGIHPDAFRDTSRRVIGGDIGFFSLEEYFDRFLRYLEGAYTRRRWENQPKQVVVWLEKEALAGVLEDIAKRYRVRLIPSRGYASFTYVYKQLVQALDLNKQLVILLLTDFDPSGQDMVRDLKNRVLKYVYNYYDYYMDREDYNGVIKVNEIFKVNGDEYWREYEAEGIEIKKVALTREQVIKYNLPPLPAKTSDPRYKWFSKAYGDEATELDALPPEVLRQLVESAIIENIDIDAWEEVKRIEEEEREKIKEIVQKLRESLNLS
ncbi:MAG: hypothetical protein J7K49_05310 [Thaumarchaeota archaeon]|nr:hypothetical protein [Nitrososphaerota archaeon]